jgi:hypothetical protein
MTTSKTSAHFSERCIRAGLNHRGCGLSAVEMLLQMRSAPLVPQCVRDPKARGGVTFSVPGNGNGAMGALIRNGLARFHRDQACYAITPNGETWLTELEIHGLIKNEEVSA